MDLFGSAGLLVILIPFITQQLKTRVPWIGTKYAPVTAFVLGITGGLAGYFTGMAPESFELIDCILSGVAIGGTSTGLYSLTNVGKK